MIIGNISFLTPVLFHKTISSLLKCVCWLPKFCSVTYVSSMIHLARHTLSPVVNMVFACNLLDLEKWGWLDGRHEGSLLAVTVRQPSGSIIKIFFERKGFLSINIPQKKPLVAWRLVQNFDVSSLDANDSSGISFPSSPTSLGRWTTQLLLG